MYVLEVDLNKYSCCLSILVLCIKWQLKSMSWLGTNRKKF